MLSSPVLVTGGAGFIGSHLVDALLKRGSSVRVLDDFSTGKRANLPDSRRLEVIEGDVADSVTVQQALKGCTAFFHLAAIASVERSVQDPVGTHKTNLEGSIVLFEQAVRAKVQRGIYASSAAVYGDSQELPLLEASELKPQTPYAIDKLAGEQYLAFYHRAQRLKGTAFRFFNVFGPRQDPTSPYSGVISIFLERALRGDPITVYGDGLQSRDFVYVGDVVSALLAGYDDRSDRPELPVFNVGRGTGVTLQDLLAAIQRLPECPAQLEVKYGAPRKGDIRHSLADNGRLRAELGWTPEVDLVRGLLATLDG